MKHIIIHTISACVLTLVFSFIGYAEIGCALSIGFYYGREVAQYQTRLIYKFRTHNHAQSIKEGWLFWKWGNKKMMEFIAPAILSVTIALCVNY